MVKTKTSRYDVTEHLRTPEDMAAYLEACREEANGDAALIAKALGDIARAKGMSQVAREAGLSRESLYKALSGERIPGFDTILKVIGALGLKLQWLASAEYFEGSGYVELEFSQKLKPFLLQLKDRFTKYQLEYALKLKKSYSIRIY